MGGMANSPKACARGNLARWWSHPVAGSPYPRQPTAGRGLSLSRRQQQQQNFIKIVVVDLADSCTADRLCDGAGSIRSLLAAPMERGMPQPLERQTRLPKNTFSDVAKLTPPNMTWRVRRQVAIGVFPSARRQRSFKSAI